MFYNVGMEEVIIEKKYVDYIENLIAQVNGLLPEDVNKLQQDYLINNLRHSAMLLASSIQDEDVFQRLNNDSQLSLIQILMEWSFHKEIDLFRSGISPKYWKIVMQKIWYTIWEVMYACAKSDADVDVIINLVERYVNITYNEAIEELKQFDVIDEDTEKQAKCQSNIDIMAEQYRRKNRLRKISKFINYVILFIFISVIISYIVMKYRTAGIITILIFLVVYNIMPVNKS